VVTQSPTVSLVLGSGGARGLAHIGIIDWLEEHGFTIRSVAGSSMGALVGGIYAAGKLDVYSNWVKALTRTDVFRLLDLSFVWTGLFKGERIIDLLRHLVGEQNIEDLPISYTAVATDIETGKEVWLNRGPLFDAVRASMAIPMVFTPYDYQGSKLVDGGLVNPVPIAPTLNDRSDITIAGKDEPVPQPTAPSNKPTSNNNRYSRAIKRFIAEFHSSAAHGRPPEWGFFDVVSRSFDTMQSTARLKLAAYSPDVIIEIPRNACRMMEFYRASEMIELGRRKAESMLRPLLSPDHV